jgi:hypothetical protein
MKRDEEVLGELAEGMPGGRTGRAWRREMEIDWTVAEGLGIYSDEFNREWHVASQELMYDPLRPIIRGWDLGATHQLPACVWIQADAIGRASVLHELATWDGHSQIKVMSMGQFAEVALLESTQMFPGVQWIDYVDPSAWTKSMVGREMRSCVDDLHDCGIYPSPGPVTFNERKDKIITLLSESPKGRPKLLIDPHCSMVIQGFQGAYKYESIGQTGRYKPTAEQNAWAHVMSALEYGLGGLYVLPSSRRDPDDRRRQKRKTRDRVTGY